MFFQNGGIFQKIREQFFHTRTVERIAEIDELVRDVDYLVGELKTLEKRTGIGNLLPHALLRLNQQLRYWEIRHLVESDREAFKQIGKEFFLTSEGVRRNVLDRAVLDYWWLNENEHGNEKEE